MTSESHSTERSRNLWAPWRLEYIRELSDPRDGCFLCRYRDEPGRDAEQLVVWRGQRVFVVMNRFPYTGGHLLVAPYPHVGALHDLDDAALLEMMQALRDAQDLLQRVLHPDGSNVGINFGRCAGAGLPGHLHLHLVPRWEGDTNFMTVLGDVRVMPQSLESLYRDLRAAAADMGLTDPPG